MSSLLRSAAVTAGLSVANSLGNSAIVIAPLWIGLIGARFDLPVWGAGFIAAAQLAAVAAADIFGSVRLHRFAPRRIGFLVLGLAAAGYLACAVPDLRVYVAGCIVAGAALGVLLAVVVGTAARSENAHRLFSVLALVHTVIAGALFLIAPVLIEHFGFAGLFAGLAVLCVLGWPSIRALPDRPPAASHGRIVPALANFGAGLGALAGLVALFAGHNAVMSHIMLRGERIDMSSTQTALILACGTFISLSGPLVGAVLGQRFGLLLPLSLGAGALALDAGLLTHTQSHLAFAVEAICFITLLMFVLPYVMTLLAQQDVFGRWAAMGPAALMIGGALGPAITATALARDYDLGQTGVLAAGLIALACLAFFGTSLRSGAVAPGAEGSPN